MSFGHCGSYIVKTGSVTVLQEYEADRNLCGVQENLRNRPEPLPKIKVTDYAH